MHSLEKKLLIAAPSIEEDAIFHRALIYIEKHDRDGAVGYIVNKASDIKLTELIASAGIEKSSIDPVFEKQAVMIGGPINTSQMYILHQPQDTAKEENLIGTNSNLMVSSNDSALKDIASGKMTDNYIVMLGKSSWSGKQLEREYLDNTWIEIDSVSEIIFGKNIEDRILLAAQLVGLDLNMMVPPLR